MRIESRVTLPETTDSRFCDRKNQFCAGMKVDDAEDLWGRSGVKDFNKLDDDKDGVLSYEEIMADQYKNVKKQKRWKTFNIMLAVASAGIDLCNKKKPIEAFLWLGLAIRNHKKMLSAKGEYSQYERIYEQILAQQNKTEQVSCEETVIAEAA